MKILEKTPLSLALLLRAIMAAALFLGLFALTGCEQAEQVMEKTTQSMGDGSGGQGESDDDDDDDEKDGDNESDEEGEEK